MVYIGEIGRYLRTRFGDTVMLSQATMETNRLSDILKMTVIILRTKIWATYKNKRVFPDALFTTNFPRKGREVNF